MSISKGYPNPIELKKNERETLQFLHTRSVIEKQFADLARKARLHYYDLADPKKLKNNDIDFSAKMEISIQGEIKQLYVGANLRSVPEARNSSRHEMVSYSIGICNGHDLIRKFHFDYAIPGQKTNQDVPVFHFQYGGELSPYLAELGISDTKIEPWLSVPRLNYQPVTLALLLDIVFCEFRTDETNKIVEDSNWRALVRKNEELVVKQYYENIASFMGSGKYRNCLIRDYCYGN